MRNLLETPHCVVLQQMPPTMQPQEPVLQRLWTVEGAEENHTKMTSGREIGIAMAVEYGDMGS